MSERSLMSMTGFVSESFELAGKGGERLVYTLEIKTLNARFCEVSCRLPSGLSTLEQKIISYLKKKLIRGKVYVTIRSGADGGLNEEISPAIETVRGYLKAAEEVKSVCGISGNLTITDILSLPHVFVFEHQPMSKEQIDAFFQAFTNAVDRLIVTRIQEGEQLYNDLHERFRSCAKAIKIIGDAALSMIDIKKQKVSKLLAVVEHGDMQAKIQLEELYRVLDKIDVHEEVTRFTGHLEVVEKVLESDRREKGRRLDFILQELMREVNTITAKCSSLTISSTAVDVKVDLEKAREQIQNIV